MHDVLFFEWLASLRLFSVENQRCRFHVPKFCVNYQKVNQIANKLKSVVWSMVNEPGQWESEPQTHVLVFGLVMMLHGMRTSIPLGG